MICIKLSSRNTLLFRSLSNSVAVPEPGGDALSIPLERKSHYPGGSLMRLLNDLHIILFFLLLYLTVIGYVDRKWNVLCRRVWADR